MSSEVRLQYATGATTVVATCSGLANDGFRESTVLLNSVNRYDDAFIQATAIVNTAAVLTAVGAPVNLWAYAGIVSTMYSGGATGTDASFATVPPQNPDNLKLIGNLPCITMGAAGVTVYYSDLFSVAAGFGGALPVNWGIVVDNQTGQVLVSVALQYQGIYWTIS